MHTEKALIYIRLANSLTVARLCAAPLLVFFLVNLNQHADYVTAAALLLLAMQMSDVLDGFLARRAQKHQRISNLFGQIMDPAADKLYINSTCITLSLTHNFPWWVTLTIFSKDLVISVAWLVVFWLSGNVLVKPDIWGKAADSSQAFLIMGFLLNVPQQVFSGWSVMTVALTIFSALTLILRDVQQKR